MRKIVIIIILLLFNFCIVYAKIKNKNLDRVDIKLRDDELAIVIIKLETSTSLLIKYQGEYLFYLIDYLNSQNIDESIKVFTDTLNNTYMRQNYSYDAEVLDHKVIGSLTLDSNRIKYKDYNICLNHSDDCDIVIALKGDVLLNKNIKTLLYSYDLDDNYIDYIDTFWFDKYRLSNQNYTIITLGDDYSVDSVLK